MAYTRAPYMLLPLHLLRLLRLLRLLLDDRLLGDLRRPARLALHFRDLRRAARLALHRRGCDLRRAARLALDGTASASLDQLICKLFERGEEHEQRNSKIKTAHHDRARTQVIGLADRPRGLVEVVDAPDLDPGRLPADQDLVAFDIHDLIVLKLVL